MKPLEALEKIDHSVCIAFNQNNKALFDKDKYDHCDCKDINEYVECEELVEKHLNALEIIVKKNVDVNYIKFHCEDCADYNVTIANGVSIDYLTLEEFDLVKEVIKSYVQ